MFNIFQQAKEDKLNCSLVLNEETYVTSLTIRLFDAKIRPDTGRWF